MRIYFLNFKEKIVLPIVETEVGTAFIRGGGGGGDGDFSLITFVMAPKTANVRVEYNPRRTKPSVGTYQYNIRRYNNKICNLCVLVSMIKSLRMIFKKK